MLTYQTVAPLIADEQESGRSMTYTFQCPVSGTTVSARYSVPRSTGASGALSASAKRTLMYEVRRSLGPLLRRVFGYSALGRMASSLADTALRQATSTSSSQGLSRKERQHAAVEAFKTVASQFTWDADNERWMSLQAAQERMSPFQRQLVDAPITNAYDRAVLARMLVEMAAVDGKLAEAERSFLLEFVSPEMGALESLVSRPPLTPAELGQTTPAASRDTLLMLAWTVALSDEAFDPGEAGKLQSFAAGLGVGSARQADLRRLAQGFLLDQALDRMITWGGHDAHARAELMAMAERIGMSTEEAQEAEAAFLRRRGTHS